MDTDEAIYKDPLTTSPANTDLAAVENAPISSGSGQGYQGFWLSYWQTTC